MANANKAIVYVATCKPEMVTEFVKSGNPAIRRAGKRMIDIRGFADQQTAERHQTAEDVIFALPMEQIQRIITLWEAR
jgi:uncharacterized protein (DUF1330 family)